jgi:hypothetical protein
MNFDIAALQNGQRMGQMQGSDVAELEKALQAGYGTDSATLTGGASLRIQSLEMTMLATIQENKHFRLFNALTKSNATATVDEWTEQTAVGGILGGSTNSELGVIPQATGTYLRRVGLVKFLMTMRQVSFVQSLQNAIVDSEMVEYQAGAKQLLTDAEFLSFEGDSSVVPTEFDGIEYQVVNFATPDNIIDMQAKPLDSITPINQGAAVIAGFGNFGVPTDIFTSLLAQADFDNYLDPAFRVPLPDVQNGGIQIGAPVRGIRTSHGDVKNQPDVFVRDPNLKMPLQYVQNGAFAATAAANNYVPAAIVVADAGATAGSMWTTPQLGQYYYAVAGLTASGESNILVSAVAAVAAAGDGMTVTITRSAGALETGYAVYRGRLVSSGGTNAGSDLRLMKRIPIAGATTVYTDLNTDIPGTVKAYMINNTPGEKAITWRQYLPMMKFPLYPTNQAIVPWAQLLFGFLRLGKAKQHVVFKNILPNLSTWRPFG